MAGRRRTGLSDSTDGCRRDDKGCRSPWKCASVCILRRTSTARRVKLEARAGECEGAHPMQTIFIETLRRSVYGSRHETLRVKTREPILFTTVSKSPRRKTEDCLVYDLGRRQWNSRSPCGRSLTMYSRIRIRIHDYERSNNRLFPILVARPVA